MIESLADNEKYAEFEYGYDNSRISMTYKVNSNIQYTKYYLGSYERTESANGSVKEVTYISSKNGLIAAIVKETSQAEKTYYIHKDYLGSIQALSEANTTTNTVTLVAQFNYDAWGRMRRTNDWTNYYADITTIPYFDILERGYTGHEHIRQFDLINMNARVYDPLLGCFLSPDNEVTDPENPQNYNRFSYALNNPLIYTDPSGNFFFSVLLPGIGTIIDGACWGALFGSFSGTEGAISGAISGALSGGLSLLWTPVGVVWGAVQGASLSVVSSGLSNGCKYLLNGKSFWEGVIKNNYFPSLLSGAISGGIRGGSLNETNQNQVENGTICLTEEQKQQIEKNFRIFGANDDTKRTFFEHIWGANSEMTITEYQFYSSSEFWIDIASEQDFALSIKNLENIQSTAYGFGYGKDGKVFATLRARIFEPNYNWRSPENTYGGLPYVGRYNQSLTNYNWDLTSAIQHELGHGYSAFILGNQYHSWASFYRENWATDYVNFSYRSGAGLPGEAFKHYKDNRTGIIDWLFKGRNP